MVRFDRGLSLRSYRQGHGFWGSRQLRQLERISCIQPPRGECGRSSQTAWKLLSRYMRFLHKPQVPSGPVPTPMPAGPKAVSSSLHARSCGMCVESTVVYHVRGAYRTRHLCHLSQWLAPGHTVGQIMLDNEGPLPLPPLAIHISNTAYFGFI